LQEGRRKAAFFWSGLACPGAWRRGDLFSCPDLRRRGDFLLRRICYKGPSTGSATMKFRLFAVPMSLLLALSGTASADVLLIDRARLEPAPTPVRGLTAAQVESRFGSPQQKLEPRGGQKTQWPVINRWVYPGFIVYFERSRVIDVVATQSSPQEVGPKPPFR